MGKLISRDSDDSILKLAADPVTGKLKVRLPLAVLKDGQYLSWPGVSWIVECDDPEDAQELRDLLKLLLTAWGKYDAETIRAALSD